MGFFSEVPVWIQEHVRISAGGHENNPQEGACIMEFVSLIDPREKRMTDHPKCVIAPLNNLAIGINDTIDDEGRQKMKQYAHRFIDTKTLPAKDLWEMVEAAEGWYKKVSKEEGDEATLWEASGAPKPKQAQKAFKVALEQCNHRLDDSGWPTAKYSELAISLIHALLPKERVEYTEKNLDWMGAFALFTPEERENIFGEAKELPKHVSEGNYFPDADELYA